MGNRHSIGGSASRRQSAESNRRPLEERLMFPFLDEASAKKPKRARKSASLVPGGKPADFQSATPASREDPHQLRLLCQHAALDDGDGVERACQDGASKYVNERTRSGMSALHVAAQHGSAEAFAALLRHGADLGVQSRCGKKAIDYAVEGKSMRVIQLIVEQQAPTDAAAAQTAPNPRRNARAAPTEPASTFSPMPARGIAGKKAAEPSSTIVQAFSRRQPNRRPPNATADKSMGSPHEAPSWEAELGGASPDATPTPPRETHSVALSIVEEAPRHSAMRAKDSAELHRPVSILKHSATLRPSTSPPNPPTPPPIFRASTFGGGPPASEEEGDARRAPHSPAQSASKHSRTPTSAKKPPPSPHAPFAPGSARGEPPTPESSQKRAPLGASHSNVQQNGSAPVSPHINKDLESAGFWDAVRSKQAERRTSGGGGTGGGTFRNLDEKFERCEPARGGMGLAGSRNAMMSMMPRVKTPREVHESVWDKLRRSDEEDYTHMLMDCVCVDDGEGITRLVRTAEARRCVNRLNHAGLAPLHTAAHMGNIKATRALILAGADLNLKSADGMTAEEHAQEMNHWQVYPLFAEARANAILSKPVHITKTSSRFSRAKRAMGFRGKAKENKENSPPAPLQPRAPPPPQPHEPQRQEVPKKKASGHRTRSASSGRTKEKRSSRVDSTNSNTRGTFRSGPSTSRVALV